MTILLYSHVYYLHAESIFYQVSAPSETPTEVTKLVEEASSDEPEKTDNTSECIAI